MRLHHEHDIFRMGGLGQTLADGILELPDRQRLARRPAAVTAGFYSKEMILAAAWAGGGGVPGLMGGRGDDGVRHRSLYFPRGLHRFLRRTENRGKRALWDTDHGAADDPFCRWR